MNFMLNLSLFQILPNASHLMHKEHFAAKALDILPFNLVGVELTSCAW
jgi:hypothetical protein